MKKNLYIIILSFLSLYSSGQVGIGTTSPNSSTALEVSSSQRNGGVLLPNVSLDGVTDDETIPNPARGIMVYNLVDAGTGTNAVQANNIYLWDGAKWKNISDMEQVKSTLLPPVFFVQSAIQQNFSPSEITSINNGSGALVTFQSSEITVNNGKHIELSNNQFIIKTAGQYELSAFVNYCPRVDVDTGFTNLDFRVQRSDNGGATWTTIASTREVWGKKLGGYFRSVIMPPSIVQDLNVGSRIRLMITRGDNYGTLHGSGSEIIPAIGIGWGVKYPKSIKFLKLN